MPSRWEGFGLAAVEALALGVPVVATEVGGLPGFIDESCGKLCDSKETFVEEISSLLSDTELYKKKISGANKRAEELDNIDQYISNMINVYKKCGVII
jgi:glycosyltransferase involved in cell wall biosynthesis